MSRSRFSPSAIARFNECPKRYQLQDLGECGPKQPPSPTLARGNAVHHALERFYGLPLEHRQPENLERALRWAWPQHRKGAFDTVEQEIEYGRGALEMLRLYGDRFDLTVNPLAREQWLNLRVADGLEVYGKVDRIDELPDGGLEVIDYKTGTRPLEPSDLKHEPATQVYVAAAAAAYGEPVRRIRLIYLALGVDVAWEIEDEDAEWLRERLDRATSAIAAATTFPASPGPHCRWCPFALRCVERTRVRLEELVPVEGLPFDLPDAEVPIASSRRVAR